MEKTKIKITINDRFSLHNLYPENTNLVSLKLIKDIKEKLELSQEEMTSIGLQSLPNGSVAWSPDKAEKTKLAEVDMNFTEMEINLLHGRLEELDKANKIPVAIQDLIFKVIEAKEELDSKAKK